MRFAPWLIAASLAGCPPTNDEDRDTDPCHADDPTLEIGTGDLAFASLDPGDPVIMVHGPQGGWHVLGSARVANTDRVVTIHYTVTDVDSDVMVADNLYEVALREEGDCTGTFPGMYAFLDVAELASGDLNTPPEILGGHTLRLAMEATDRGGRTASATLEVTATLDPRDLPD